jgi:hypothetical protein
LRAGINRHSRNPINRCIKPVAFILLIKASENIMSHIFQRPSKFALTLGLLLPLLVGCSTTQAVDRAPSYTTTKTQASFSEAQLDSLLAPIALYPDTVLSHVLIASTYPLEVVEADRWARNNSRYKGDDAVNAVDSRDWDPSVKALVAFPDILQRMSEDLDWTQQLGDAFLADEEGVMDSVQRLRNRAYASGNLDKVEHVRVIREEKTIVIEPSVERVVYVPAYDTRVVYGNWWWPDYPPVYWRYPSSYVFVSGFYWGPRVHIGPRFYFSGCHWHERRVYVVDRHHHHGHRFYDSRSVVRHANATRWNHNPVHRRGVAYYDSHTRERFNSPRESYRESRTYRNDLRGDNRNQQWRGEQRTERNNPRIAPNLAREGRQDRAQEFQQRLERRQAGQITSPTNRNSAAEPARPRAEHPRERTGNRIERASGRDSDNLASPRNRDGQNRETIRQRDIETPRARQPDGNIERQPRVNRVETPRAQNPQRQQIQTIERQPHRIEGVNRVERSERIQDGRSERPQRAEPRMERPRDSGMRESRSIERGDVRGGRER